MFMNLRFLHFEFTSIMENDMSVNFRCSEFFLLSKENSKGDNANKDNEVITNMFLGYDELKNYYEEIGYTCK